MIDVTEKDIKEMEQNYTEAVSTFDFQRVKKCVDVLQWKWYRIGSARIPTIEDMYVVVDNLFDKIISGLKNTSDNLVFKNISTGGFTVEVGDDNHVEIKFTVESSEWYSDWDIKEENF